MTRLHADLVEVRTRTEPSGPVPEQFLWRGRLYVVREVLGRWTTSGSWWRAARQGDDHGDDRVDDRVDDRQLDDRERQWWRVEADSGRLAALSGGSGTYDLCFCWHTGWTLRRVLD